MGFEGDVQTISLFDLLQMLSSGQRTGTMYITGKNGSVTLFLGKDMVRLLDTSNRQQLGYKEIIVSESPLSRRVIAEAIRESARSGIRLEDWFHQQDLVQPQHFWGWIRRRIEEEIFSVFTWKDAHYRFVDGETMDRSVGDLLSRIEFDTTTLLFEGARRFDELEHFKADYPTEETVFSLTTLGETQAQDPSLPAQRELLFELLREGATVTELMYRTELYESRVYAEIQELMQAGTVRAGKPGEDSSLEKVVPAKERKKKGTQRVWFGTLAVQLGFTEVQQIESALAEQTRDRSVGRARNLGEILSARGILSDKEVEHILQFQKTCTPRGTIGGYSILFKVDQDMFGPVYRAVDNESREPVLVKLFQNRFGRVAEGADLSRAFRTLQKVQHRTLCGVRTVGKDKGILYAVMNPASGHTLSTYMQQGIQFDRRTVLTIYQQMVAGLSYAASLGVLHLDLRPGSILLSDAGQVTMLNLGLTQVFSKFVEFEEEDFTLRSPVYVAPENRQGRIEEMVSTDIYSLGVLLYEMFTGRAPDTPFPDRPEQTGLTVGLHRRLSSMLCPDPAGRPQDYNSLKQLWERATGVRLRPGAQV